ncbi:uncharacterized protein BT62DRAFT_955523 [Guyanagaster necrorhizus]|uniref:Uncharacterized protein n=1 Tax=Guyanagaster necrorhizus TaxID=856835 RepID=A0A9P7VKR3_9AGAR|nr:uncharacterized protein BT62DRAFT_955523 [Guyanagaster necrorhizus MCA 3950]KAG7441704.1 hypothetical protein BT62DRAFT_955523 [Guyanagaster necrorhizus MCA 3950]
MMQRFASSAALALAIAASSVSAQSSSTTFPEGVLATGTMGTTNPAEPTLGTTVNQTSYARLLSLNSVDDWCIFAPPSNNTIGESEAIEVAWCTKARNNARVIPDGVVTGVSFLKTDFYVQIYGYGDFTKLNIAAGDYGGELDPHGATGAGNPVGGNVTTDEVTGSDINIAEWMQFISYTQFCIRACTNANSSYSAAEMCEHKLDEMGCAFVMPGNYDFNGTFETCDADVAYPPGWYPEVTGGTTSYSTFAQYYTGYYTDSSGSTVSYTVGDTVTPSTVAFTPASSNCATTASISNGLAVATSGSSGSASGSSGASGSKSGSSSSKTASGTSSSSTGNAAVSSFRSTTSYHDGVTLVALISGIAAIVLLH